VTALIDPLCPAPVASGEGARIVVGEVELDDRGPAGAGATAPDSRPSPHPTDRPARQPRETV
jgi:hypothetical protein